MTWYTASIIHSIKYTDSSIKQQKIPVYENIVLIQASNRIEALEKAKIHAAQIDSIDDQLELNSIPAQMKFEGVRKLLEVSAPLDTGDELEVKELNSGVELSYSYVEVENEDDLKKLAQGQSVKIDYMALE